MTTAGQSQSGTVFLFYNWSMQNAFLLLARAPRMYGAFHILFVLGAFLLSFFLGYQSRSIREKTRERMLFGIALGMVCAEVLKQLVLTFQIGQGKYDWYHFPFQLCSLPMYLGISLPFFSDRGKKTIEAFLLCFGFFAAGCAYLYPQDMLSRNLFLLLHSFTYHACMILLACLCFYGERLSWKDFGHACIVFLASSGIAEVLNVLVHAAGYDMNMFYIQPYTPTTQPVFHEIAVSCGIPFEILLYLSLILLSNTGIFALYRLFRSHSICKGDHHAK
jgi:hypothetical protein